MVLHPYFSSVVGFETDVILAPKGSELYEAGRQHFENLWGNRWVIFDIGNVLMNFSHTVISTKLWEHLSKNERAGQSAPQQESIHEWIFNSMQGRLSPNAK